MKIKITMGLIAFLTLFLTIAVFIFSMNIYKNNQLKRYVIIENVIVKRIHDGIKHNPSAFFAYQNKKYSTNLSATSLKLNDTVKIIYSKRNPKTINFLNEFKKE